MGRSGHMCIECENFRVLTPDELKKYNELSSKIDRNIGVCLKDVKRFGFSNCLISEYILTYPEDCDGYSAGPPEYIMEWEMKLDS